MTDPPRWHHRRPDGTFDRLPTVEDADERGNIFVAEAAMVYMRHYGDFDPRCKIDYSQHAVAWHPKPKPEPPAYAPEEPMVTNPQNIDTSAEPVAASDTLPLCPITGPGKYRTREGRVHRLRKEGSIWASESENYMRWSPDGSVAGRDASDRRSIIARIDPPAAEPTQPIETEPLLVWRDGRESGIWMDTERMWRIVVNDNGMFAAHGLIDSAGHHDTLALAKAHCERLERERREKEAAKKPGTVVASTGAELAGDGSNVTVGVTVHCGCGTWCDDVVAGCPEAYGKRSSSNPHKEAAKVEPVRWEHEDTFVAACAAFHASGVCGSIADVNRLQDELRSRGYSIRREVLPGEDEKVKRLVEAAEETMVALGQCHNVGVACGAQLAGKLHGNLAAALEGFPQ